MLKPEYVVPLVDIVCSAEAPEPTGDLYEGESGWFAATRWQRTWLTSHMGQECLIMGRQTIRRNVQTEASISWVILAR